MSDCKHGPFSKYGHYNCYQCDNERWLAVIDSRTEELKAVIEQQKGEIAGLRKDAERYQFLRNRDLDTIDCGGIFVGKIPDNIVINGDDLDRETDAAIASTKAGEK